MAHPVLYSFRRCPFAMRARLALAVSGTSYEHREVILATKPVAMLSVSPKGTVPVLQLPNGTVIEESLEIMRWALETRDPEAWLARDDPALIATNDDVFKGDLDRYKYPERYGVDPVVHRTSGLAFLREVEGRLAKGAQLCGSVRGLTDAAIMPFLRQFAAVDRKWFDAEPLPLLKTWLAQHVASDLFSTIMFRMAPWSEGDPPIIVTN